MAFEVFSMVGRIAIDGVNKVKSGLGDIEKATTKLAKTGSTQFQKFNTSFQGINDKIQKNSGAIRAVGATFTGIGVAVGLAGASMITAGASFDTSMRRVGALTKTTGDDFTALRDQAKDLGATTAFSANEAAGAMAFLAQAGFDANEIMGSMAATLSLAAASQIDLATAADISSNILSGFGIAASELTSKVDALVNTTINSNTNMIQLGEGMKFIAPVAAAAGVSLEDVAAAMGLLGNAGIQGSMAGTTLRTAITRLLTPSADAATAMTNLGLKASDASGNFVGFDGIVRQLEATVDTYGSKTDFVADLMEVFGQRGGPGMAALLGQGSKAMEDMQAAIAEVGTAATVAEAIMAGTEGAMIEWSSAMEGLKIAIHDSGIGDFFATLVRGATEGLRALSQLNPTVLKFGALFVAAMGGIAAVLGPFLLFLPTMSAGIGQVLIWLGAGSSGGGLLGAITALTGPIGWVTAAVVALTAGLIIWRTEIAEFLLGALSLLGVDVQALLENINSFITVLQEIGGVIIDVVVWSLGQLGEKLGWVFDTISSFVNLLRDEGKKELDAFSDATGTATDKTHIFVRSLGKFVSVSKENKGELQKLVDVMTTAAERTDLFAGELQKIALGTVSASKGSKEFKVELQEVADAIVAAAEGTKLETGELQEIAEAMVLAAGGTDELTIKTKKLTKEENLAEKSLKKVEKAAEKARKTMEKWMKLLKGKFLDSTRDAFVLTQKLGDEMVLTADKIEKSLKNRIVPAWELIADEAEKANKEIEDAFEAMGIKTTRELLDIQNTAKEQYDLIAGSGIASAQQIDQAWVIMTQARKAAMVAQGADISAEEQAMLDAMLASQRRFKKDSTDEGGVFVKWANGVKSIVRDLSGELIKNLFTGDFSFGGKFAEKAKVLADSFKNIFIDKAQAMLTDFVNKGLNLVLSKLDSIVDALTGSGGVGAALGKVFGVGGGGGGSTKPSVPGTPSLPGTDTVGKVIGTSFSAITNVVTGVVSAISGIFGNFQQARMNKSLKDIEVHTRRAEIHLGGPSGILESIHTYLSANEWTRHGQIMERLGETAAWIADGQAAQHNLLISNDDMISEDLVSELGNIAAKVEALKPSIIINVENMGVDGASDINAIAQELFELSQTVG